MIVSEPGPGPINSIAEELVPSAIDVTNIDKDNLVPPAQSTTTEPCDCKGYRKVSDRPVPFQPIDTAILSQFELGKRKFLPSWYSAYK